MDTILANQAGPGRSQTLDLISPKCSKFQKRGEFSQFAVQAKSVVVKLGSGEPFAESPLHPDERTSSDRTDWCVSVESRMGAVAWAIWQRSVSHPTGSPEAVARLRLPQNVACGFTALRSSTVASQHCKSLQLRMWEAQLWFQ